MDTEKGAFHPSNGKGALGGQKRDKFFIMFHQMFQVLRRHQFIILLFVLNRLARYDNDISNVTQGIHIWQQGGVATESQFGMYTDNSIHNVIEGIYLQLTSNPGIDNSPWMMCNSFSDNIINGIRDFPFAAAPFPAAFYIDYSMQSTVPPQVLMNIFSGNIVTGVDVGVVLYDASVSTGLPGGVPLGITIFSSNFFASAGANGSTEGEEIQESNSPIVAFLNTWLGFWQLGSLDYVS